MLAAKINDLYQHCLVKKGNILLLIPHNSKGRLKSSCLAYAFKLHRFACASCSSKPGMFWIFQLMHITKWNNFDLIVKAEGWFEETNTWTRIVNNSLPFFLADEIKKESTKYISRFRAFGCKWSENMGREYGKLLIVLFNEDMMAIWNNEIN